MWSQLGADLGGVRLHSGGASSATGDEAGAQAVTIGSDIHFGSGRLDLGDPYGLHLLAHEVTPTVQQADGLAWGRSGRVPATPAIPSSTRRTARPMR